MSIVSKLGGRFLDCVKTERALFGLCQNSEGSFWIVSKQGGRFLGCIKTGRSLFGLCQKREAAFWIVSKQGGRFSNAIFSVLILALILTASATRTLLVKAILQAYLLPDTWLKQEVQQMKRRDAQVRLKKKEKKEETNLQLVLL